MALSVAEALARILEGVEPTIAEHAGLLSADHRVLATTVSATLTQPPFNASAMDGYAVRAADVAQLPARLRLSGEAAAGRAFGYAVNAGEAVRIFTGAPVPDGADAVVIQENTERDGEDVIIREGQPDHDHIRLRGCDFALGDPLIAAGRRLTPRDITLAAAMGHATLPVRRAPKVAIIATGDELVVPGAPRNADQIVCSNPYGIAAMLRRAGGEPHFIGIAKDNPESLGSLIDASSGFDLLMTIGGASVGDHDLVAKVLVQRGMTLDFWKIAMRPGKPLLFGRLGEQRVIGVPGNPVSSLICTRVFAVPLIHRMLGLADTQSGPMMAPLAHSLEANGPRAHYMRAQWRPDRSVAALPSQDSSLLAPLAQADCIIVRPPKATALPAGADVPVLPLDF